MNAETNDEKNQQREDIKSVVYNHEPVDDVKELRFTEASGTAHEYGKSSRIKQQEGHESKEFSEILPKSYEEMDQEFLNYLKLFNKNSENQEKLKNELKERFFQCVMICMAAIIFFPYLLVFMFRDNMTDFSIIALSISSLAETLSAVIVLPKIIAKYLFNKKEEENKIKIISDMQAYNRGKRE